MKTKKQLIKQNQELISLIEDMKPYLNGASHFAIGNLQSRIEELTKP